MGWTEFIAALLVFYLSHSIPVRKPVRSALIRAVGQRGYLFLYSALSLAALIWLIVAAGRAPYLQLWPRAEWQAHVPLLAMLMVCFILAFSIGKPNPLSFGGTKNDRFDPSRPGIVRWFRHPLLIALGLWAAAHSVPNGDLAHALLFIPLAVFAFAGQRLIDQRKQRESGQKWRQLIKIMETSATPIARPTLDFYCRSLIAVLLYFSLIWLHPTLLGVSALP